MTNMTDKIAIVVPGVRLTLPHEHWATMHAIYTRWVHDANCPLLKDFTVQGVKMRPELLTQMGVKLTKAIETADRNANAVIEKIRDKHPGIAKPLMEANHQRSRDAFLFRDLHDHHNEKMNELMVEVENFRKYVGAKLCTENLS